jgi:hypothetical protein
MPGTADDTVLPSNLICITSCAKIWPRADRIGWIAYSGLRFEAGKSTPWRSKSRASR